MAKVFVRDLQAGQTYGIQLRSDDGEAVSEWSPISYVATDVATIGPSNVNNLQWTSQGTSFLATWDAVTTNVDGSPLKGPVFYEVVISNDGTNLYYQPTETRFDFSFEMNRDGFGTPRADLTISVRAVNTSGVKSPAAATAFAQNAQPEPPTGLTATAYTNQIVVKWVASTSDDVVAYRVHRGSTSGFTPTEGNKIWTGAAFTATDFSTDYSTDHFYKVAAIDVFGTASTFAATTGAVRPLDVVGAVDSTPPTNPTGVAASTALNSDSSGQFVDLTVSWTGPTAAADPSLSHFVVRYGYDGTTWQYTNVPRDQLSTKISRILAGGSLYVQVQAVDYSANRSAYVSAPTYPMTVNKDTTGPSQPAAPTASKGGQKIQVSHTLLKQAGGSMESDLDYFEVYAGTTTGFTANTSSMLGTMKVNVVAVETFHIPATNTTGTTQNWYVKVIPVDRAGNKGPVSPVSSAAAVDLILTANIGSAQITDAKINDLAANKITAGTGIINDITVKSKLTLGDASTVGAIETFGYVAGTTGARFDKNTLEINQGSIAAQALRLQIGRNLIPPQYASFEFIAGYYEDNKIFSTGPLIDFIPDTAYVESTRLQVVWNTTYPGGTVYFGTSDTDYNIPVESMTDFIFSLYVKEDESAGTKNFNIGMKFDSGTTATSSTQSITSGAGWTRYSYSFTVPNGVAKGLVFFTTQGTSGKLSLDALQVEKKTGSTTTPSTWSPASTTVINGGMVSTGVIDGQLIRADSIRSDAIESDTIQSRHLVSDFVLSKVITTGNPGEARVWIGPSDNTQTPPAVGGIKVFQADSDGGSTYIHLPDDGSEATFSGHVNAKSLSVDDVATLKDTNFKKGSTVILKQGVTAPTSPPIVEATHLTLNLKAVDANTELFVDGVFAAPVKPVANNIQGMDADSTEILLCEYIYKLSPYHEGSRYWIYDRNTLVCKRVVDYHTSDDQAYTGIVKISGRYFSLYDDYRDGVKRIREMYLTGPTPGGLQTLASMSSDPSYTHYVMLGKNHTTGNLLLAWDASGDTYKVSTWSIGASTATRVGTTLTTGSKSFFANKYPHGVIQGTFTGWAGDRIVLHGDGSNGVFVFNNTGVYQDAEYFPVAHDDDSYFGRAMCYDGVRFLTYSNDGKLYTYSNATWTDTGGTASDTVWVKTTYYRDNPTGADYETSVGGNNARKSVSLGKRQYLKISDPSLPTNPTTPPASDEADALGIYLVRGSDDSLGYRRYTYTSPGVNSVTTDTIGTTDSPPATSTFPEGNPAVIESSALSGTTGLPLVKVSADGYAHFEKMIVNSSTDANKNSGNEPPLRVGPPTGSHLRIDGNEILSMSSDTVPGNLGLQGKFFAAWDWNTTTITTNANGDATISHGLGTTPSVVICTFWNPAGNINNIILVTAKTATDFSINIRTTNTAAALASTSRNIMWFAIG